MILALVVVCLRCKRDLRGNGNGLIKGISSSPDVDKKTKKFLRTGAKY